MVFCFGFYGCLVVFFKHLSSTFPRNIAYLYSLEGGFGKLAEATINRGGVRKYIRFFQLKENFMTCKAHEMK